MALAEGAVTFNALGADGSVGSANKAMSKLVKTRL